MNLFDKNNIDILNAIGTFCLGVGTVALAYISYDAVASFYRWRTEKIFDRKSLIAEDALTSLESYDMCINQWLLYANSWLIYNRNDKANMNKFHELPEDKKIQFNKNCDVDPYEVHNFCKKFENDFLIFIKAKNTAYRLNEEKLYQKFIDLEVILKPLSSQIMRLHHVSYPPKEKEFLADNFGKISDSLTPLVEGLKKQLLNKIHFID